MQEFFVFLILGIAIGIIWKHMAPRVIRIRLHHVFGQLATKMGWQTTAENLSRKTIIIASESGCHTCSNCPLSQQLSGCEMRIPEENHEKH